MPDHTHWGIPSPPSLSHQRDTVLFLPKPQADKGGRAQSQIVLFTGRGRPHTGGKVLQLEKGGRGESGAAGKAGLLTAWALYSCPRWQKCPASPSWPQQRASEGWIRSNLQVSHYYVQIRWVGGRDLRGRGGSRSWSASTQRRPQVRSTSSRSSLKRSSRRALSRST